MPQNFLNKKVLFTLMATGLMSKVATLQMFAHNEFDITPEQYMVLALLDEQGELYQRQICEMSYKDRPNITRIINILENNGLVKRIPDVNGRKVLKVHVTEKGRIIHAKIKPYVIKLRDEMVKNIPVKDLELCQKVLGQMLDNLEGKVKLQI